MRTETKFTGAFLLTMLIVPHPAVADVTCIGNGLFSSNLGPKLLPIAEKIEKVHPPEAPACEGMEESAECSKCIGEIKSQHESMPPKLKAAAQRDGDIASGACNDAQAAAAKSATEQADTVKGAGSIATLGKFATDKRMGFARQIGEELSKCSSAIKKACNNVPDKTPVANAARIIHDSCDDGTQTTTAFTAAKSSDSMNLGDMAKTMSATAQLMGAAAQLAQLANKQGGAGSGMDPNSGMTGGQFGATAPSGSSINSSSTQPQTSGFGDGSGKSAANTVSLGVNPNAAKLAASQTGAGTPGSNYNSSRMVDGTGGYSGTGASAEAGKVAAAGAGGGAGGGGGGMHSGTGASSPGPGGRGPASDEKAAGSGQSYEMSGSGGVTNRAMMMGIKPGGGDLGEVTGGAATGDVGMPALGDGSVAASESGLAAAGIEPESGENLFNTVHTKYSLLLKKGRF